MFTNDKHLAKLFSLLKTTHKCSYDPVLALHQGALVLKDFNIAERAGGPGRELIMNFTANVVLNTLEIHLYWAGRGTTAIPERGFYGPSISAITVTPSKITKLCFPFFFFCYICSNSLMFFLLDFTPATGEHRLSTGAIIGIVFTSLATLGIISVVVLWMCGFFGKKEVRDAGNVKLSFNFVVFWSS